MSDANAIIRSQEMGASRSACDSQSGCSWTKSCTGTPTACASLISKTSCQSQPGCTWQ